MVDYEAFTAALLSQLGRTNLDALTPSLSWPEMQKRLATFVGPSGFSLFQTIDHGTALSALTGRAVRAVTYVFGNALIALEMTRHVAMCGLYVPLRLFVQELEPRRVQALHDVPSAALGQFGLPEVADVAASLDAKVEALIADAMTRAAA